MVQQSYWVCHSLQDALLSVLRMVLRPSPAEKTPDLKHLQDQVMRGVCYENAMVFTCSPQDSMGYKCFKWQLWLNCSFQLWDVRSLHSQIVGPVTYMWRPFSRADDKSRIEGDQCTSHCIHDESVNSSRRQLWIWISPIRPPYNINKHITFQHFRYTKFSLVATIPLDSTAIAQCFRHRSRS